MFSSVPQPPLVSLFSSTGSDPLALWETSVDDALPEDSFVCLLDDAGSLPAPAPPAALIQPPPLQADPYPGGPSAQNGYLLGQTSLHIQSPTLMSTYMCCPPRAGRRLNTILELKHPWMCLQVRNLRREWAFEVGLVDAVGIEGVVRCSTFQKQPELKATSPPLLCLPLALPSPSAHMQTPWLTIHLYLPSLLSHFTSAALSRERDDYSPESARVLGQAPNKTYSHVSYVKVYATCRLRRIWFSQSRPGDESTKPWEFGLYSST